MNNLCKDHCDNNYVLDITDKTCYKSCKEGTYLTHLNINGKDTSICNTSCTNLIQEGKCVEICSQYYTIVKNELSLLECIPCLHSNKKYILDDLCVEKCPPGYLPISDESLNLTNICIKSNKLIDCSNYCLNNGICLKTNIPNILTCDCSSTNFYGKRCQYSEEDLNNIKENIDVLINDLSDINYKEQQISYKTISDINDLTVVLTDIPEIDNSKIDEIVKDITNSQLNLVLNNKATANKGLFMLSDSSLTLSSNK